MKDPQTNENTFCLYHVQFSFQLKIPKQANLSQRSQKLILNKQAGASVSPSRDLCICDIH